MDANDLAFLQSHFHVVIIDENGVTETEPKEGN
jgi:hypothetical protein